MLADPRHPVSLYCKEFDSLQKESCKSSVMVASVTSAGSETVFSLMYCETFIQAESTSATNESVLKVALDHGKQAGVIKSHDRVVVCQKVGDASVVKIIELED